MSKIFNYIFLLGLALTTLQACGGDEKMCETPFLQATINETVWEMDSIYAFSFGGNLRFVAQQKAGNNPNFSFQLTTDVGVETLDLTQNFRLIFTTPDGYPRELRSGTLKISEHDTEKKTLVGTFECVTEPADFIIKKGSFCVKY